MSENALRKLLSISLVTPEVRKAISKAFRLASTDCEAAEPLDWFETRQPRRWRFADGVEGAYEWYIDGVAKEAKTYDKDN